jgi:hypothetical protein
MSDAITHRAVSGRMLGARTDTAGFREPSRLPVGIGLALGAAASLGLWLLAAWIVMRAFGGA